MLTLIVGFSLGFIAGFILMAVLASGKISALQDQIDGTWDHEKIQRVLNRKDEYEA